MRRLVGYDRYEGLEAARILAELYEVIRLYVNFFQPSMRLVSKSRLGAKTKRLYDAARTPYDRVLEAKEISRTSKTRLRRQYHSLDPVQLLDAIKRLQDGLPVANGQKTALTTQQQPYCYTTEAATLLA